MGDRARQGSRTYLQPVARLPPAAAGPSIVVKGRSDLAFAAAALIVRDGRAVDRTIVPAGDPRIAEDVPSALRARLCSPIPPLRGLGLDTPRLVGIINVTSDSFYDGGRHLAPEAAIAHALRLVAEGADILDIGGESTRPGAEDVAAEDELARVLPVIEGLRGRTRALLSVDTRSALVMRRAAAAGVDILNDVSALRHDRASLAAAAETGLPIVLIHSRGPPRTMQNNPRYADVVLDVYDALEKRILACEAAGIPRARLIVDPGIGFGKTLAHNLALLASLSILHGLGCAVMLGASRKSFIGALCGAPAPERLPGSLAAALAAAAQGVELVRVHDVAATRQALSVWQGMRGG
jgi:dihydropteroate synthase